MPFPGHLTGSTHMSEAKSMESSKGRVMNYVARNMQLAPSVLQ